MVYIPEMHKKYGFLPNLVKNGGKVFSYPTELVDEKGYNESYCSSYLISLNYY